MRDWEYYQKQEAKDIRKLNKDYLEGVKDINNYKEVLTNINKLYIEYKKFPAEYQNNLIFALKYFSINRDEKNYKKIPKEMLKDKFFIHNVIDNNPDLYFYIDNSIKGEFKDRVLKKADFMKYYDKEDFENIQAHNITESIIKNNYLYIKEEYILKHELIFKYRLNHEQYKKIHKEIYNIINGSIDNQLKFLSRDSNFISVIDFSKNDIMNEKNNIYLVNAVSVNTELIKYIPEELKKDLKFIEKIIITIAQKENNNYNFGSKEVNYNQANLFNEIDFEEYSKRKYQILNDRNKIYKEYKDYNNDIKMNKVILLNMFKPSYQTNSSIEIEVIKQIPDEKLRKIIEDEYKKSSDRTFKVIGDKLTNIISAYLFEMELIKETKSTNENKLGNKKNKL